MRWETRTADEYEVEKLSRDGGVSPLLARLLWLRGVKEAEEATRFLGPRLAELPDPSTMADMDRAAARLADALAGHEAIAVYGDYDVDGVTSTALIVRFLRSLGCEPAVFVPDRFVDGYGLSTPRVKELVAEGARLLLTVDCGTAHAEAVSAAQEAGCDVIVVDHHAVPPEPSRPYALLNPVRSDCGFRYERVAAVGVAFMLAAATRRVLRERGWFELSSEPDLRELLELVALGTVADVMPLKDVNRIFVSHGLRLMNRAPSLGLAALAEASGISGREIASSDLGFRLGPRINAAGRMTHAGGGLELLLTGNEERAQALARSLNEENEARRREEKRVLDEALAQGEAQVDPSRRGLVLFGESWHLGVVGIVSSRVRERLHRPNFILGTHPEDGLVKGSGRSVTGFDLVEALRGCEEHLVQYGGHAHAAGVTLRSDQVEGFRRSFEERAAAKLSEEDLEPRLRLDGDLELYEATLELADRLAALAPFGNGNPRPVFAVRNVRAESHRRVGAEGAHLQIRLRGPSGTVKAIGFDQGERADLLAGPVDLACQVHADTWRGKRYVELRVRDLREAASDEAA